MSIFLNSVLILIDLFYSNQFNVNAEQCFLTSIDIYFASQEHGYMEEKCVQENEGDNDEVKVDRASHCSLCCHQISCLYYYIQNANHLPTSECI